MFRIYLDDDVESIALAAALRALDIDALRPTEAGTSGKSDEAHLLFAYSQGRVLYTANRGDFARLHAAFARDTRHHSGIIIRANHHISFGEQARMIAALAATLDEADMADHIEWIHRERPNA